MLYYLAHALLRLAGWKCENNAPDLPKYVVLAVPHTANFDGALMVWMNYACGLRARWLVKDSAYRFPFRGLLNVLGAVPVNRSRSNNLVKQIAQQFQDNDHFHLVLSPEGTRGYRDYWKSGFYHIALEAKVPVVLSYLDYSRKRGGFGPVFELTGDITADMNRIRSFYQTSWARYPENMAPIRLPEEDAELTGSGVRDLQVFAREPEALQAKVG